MEQRRYFRIRDKLRLAIRHQDAPVVPTSQDTQTKTSFMMSMNELVKIVKKVSTSSTDTDLSDFAIEQTIHRVLSKDVAKVDNNQYLERAMFRVSLSEGGICVELPSNTPLPEIGQSVEISLELDHEDNCVHLHAILIGAQKVSNEALMAVRFEFQNLSEADRQKVFRYVFRQQTKRVND